MTLSVTFLPYYFVRTILSIPFSPIPFCPLSFCPRTEAVREQLLRNCYMESVLLTQTCSRWIFIENPVYNVQISEYWGCDLQILGWGSWGLHEILLYPTMYRNIR